MVTVIWYEYHFFKSRIFTFSSGDQSFTVAGRLTTLCLEIMLQALLQPQNAEKDYATALGFLQGPGGDLADPEELPTAL